MFSKETYINRRNQLRTLMTNKGAYGKVVLLGNDNVPYNCAKNPYDYFRQDSTFRYFFGLNQPGLIGIIDLEGEKDIIVGQEQTEDDIIWSGQKTPLAGLAFFEAGIELFKYFMPTYPEMHHLPSYRNDRILLSDRQPSLELIQSIVELRSKKDADEIAHLDDIQKVGYEIHNIARTLAGPGIKEQAIVAEMIKIIKMYGGNVSFPIILSRDGHILHNETHEHVLEEGDLLLVDAGYESPEGYCTDHTRTWVIGDRASSAQREIYSIVLSAKQAVEKNAAPGVYYKDMHRLASRIIAQGLKEIGLMKGDVEEAVAAGAHALFFPHGLGHMMGMDCHDMEALGEDYVGYDSTVTRSDQFGLAYLRMARKLQEGFVVTNEPGIYFNPYLIDKWKAENMHPNFINYTEVKKYRNFGGIRLEDDLLITENGCRLLGEKQIPI